MDDPIHLQAYTIAPALGLDVPPCGGVPFEELVSRWEAALAHAAPGGVVLADVAAMAEARAFALACQAQARPFAVAAPCDSGGETAAGVDVLALLIVAEGMGASAFGLCASPEEASAQLDRLAAYASVPLFRLAGVEMAPCPPVRPVRRDPDVIACAGNKRARFITPDVEMALWPPVRRDPDVIACAGNKRARFITPDVDVGETLECSPDLLEDILRAEDEPVGAMKLAILEPDDLDIFAAHQYAVEEALCLWSDVPELLENALRLYQGRAFYDGTGDLEPEFLAEMTRKYGLVVL